MSPTRTGVQPEPQSLAAFQLRNIVVAHDASPAAGQALTDAVELARKFGAEIILARVEPPGEEFSSTANAVLRAEDYADLESIREKILEQGSKARVMVRSGHVGDTLFDICCKENADLLLLGAYGMGTRDRRTLGSTAEHLLRSIPCPVLTYGPRAESGLLERLRHRHPILLPVELPCSTADLETAARFARLLGGEVEILHIVDSAHAARLGEELEQECWKLAEGLSRRGVPARACIFTGVPEIFIYACSAERKSPLLIMPLRRRDRLSSITSDNIAAQVIRRATVPILTYRMD